MRWRFDSRVVVVVVVCVCVVVLAFFNPDGGSVVEGWFPRCPFFALTGLRCPGCGSTHAFYALVHGDVSAAFAYNPFTLIVIPLLVLKLFLPPAPRAALVPMTVALFVATVIFGVVRNVS